MNNWRLLLLAVVVVVQPIGSFTESNLIDGGECCERSEDARLGFRKTDDRRPLDEHREDRRTANEQRRLKTLDGFREERYYETTRGPMLIRSESLERRRRISPERRRSTEHRLVREQERRNRDTFARTRETKDQSRNRDESRNILGQNERDSLESRSRDTLDATRTVSLSRDVRDTRSVERDSRNTMSGSQIRAIRTNEERRFTQNRETTILKREREDIARSATRRDARVSAPTQSDSRIQLDDSRERRGFDRRTREDDTEIRRLRFSVARVNGNRAQRTVEKNERNNRVFSNDGVELRMSQRDTELRDRVSAVRRNSEGTLADIMRDSRDQKTRIVRDRMDTRINQRTDEQRQSRDESRRIMDSLRNAEERRFHSRQIRASRTLDMTTKNDERMERQSLSMDRLSKLRESRESRQSRSFERNNGDERAARIRDVRDESSDERRQRDVNRISRDRTEPRQEVRRTASRMDIREPTEDRRQQREVRNIIEPRQETLRTVSRRDARESSEELGQKREVSRISRARTNSIREVRETKRPQESRRSSREILEERRLQREDSRLSRDRITPLRVVRDTSERELSKIAKKSSERRQRDNNLSRYRITYSMLHKDRMIRNTERTQEAHRVISPSRTEMYLRKQDSRSRHVQYKEMSDLRRQVLERSMERARITRSMSADSSRILEDPKANESDERQQTRDQGRSMEQRETRNVATPQRLDTRTSSRIESIQRERVVRNRDVRQSVDQDRIKSTIVLPVATPQRLDTRRSSRTESIRLERLVRNRGEATENKRRETQREERDSDRTRILLNHRSSENMFGERRENSDHAKDFRKVRMTRNRSEVRSERVLAERRNDNRDNTRNSRNIRGGVRSDRVSAERRQNRESRNVQGEIRMDSRERSLQRESRDASTERLAEGPRDSFARRETAKKNERGVQSDKSLRIDARRESRNDIRANNVFAMERIDRTEIRFAKDGKREMSHFRNDDAMTFRDTVVQESDERVASNWQMLFYTLQGVYLCGLLVQMLTENSNKTKKRTFSWWSSPKNLIKVD